LWGAWKPRKAGITVWSNVSRLRVLDQARIAGTAKSYTAEILFQANLNPAGLCARRRTPLVIDKRGGRASYHRPKCQPNSGSQSAHYQTGGNPS
jgi:hypothetical protein